MKALKRLGNNKTTKFDLTAQIVPSIGLGGYSFKQTIRDFQDILTNKSFDSKSFQDFNYVLDDKYFTLTITTKNNEMELVFNLFTAKINSMTCKKGYLGQLDNKTGIGTSIKTALTNDDNLGFNLDTDWFNRTPFDGLIIYPPLELKDECINAAINGTDFPDFCIETIELIDLDFAREHFPNGELTFDYE